MGCRGSHLVVLCAVAWEGRGKNVVSKVRVCPGHAGLFAGSTQCVSFMRNQDRQLLYHSGGRRQSQETCHDVIHILLGIPVKRQPVTGCPSGQRIVVRGRHFSLYTPTFLCCTVDIYYLPLNTYIFKEWCQIFYSNSFPLFMGDHSSSIKGVWYYLINVGANGSGV